MGRTGNWVGALLVAVLACVVMLLATQAKADQNAGAIAGSVASTQSGATAGGGSVTITDQSTTIADIPKGAAMPAANIMLNGCQEGASGQGYSSGAASGFESPSCVALRMAGEHQRLMIWYDERGDAESSQLHHNQMIHYMTQADEAADVTHWPKTVGSTFVSLLPVGLLFLLL